MLPLPHPPRPCLVLLFLPLALAQVEIDEFQFNCSTNEPPHIQNDMITINKRQAADHRVGVMWQTIVDGSLLSQGYNISRFGERGGASILASYVFVQRESRLMTCLTVAQNTLYDPYHFFVARLSRVCRSCAQELQPSDPSPCTAEMTCVCMQARLAISHALAQSTKLCVYEERMVDLVEETKHLPVMLAKKGHADISTKKVKGWAAG